MAMEALGGEAMGNLWNKVTPKMREMIRDMFPTTDTEKLAEMLGVSSTTVRTYARRLGVTKQRNRHPRPVKPSYDPNWVSCWGGYCHPDPRTHKRYMDCIIPMKKTIS